MSPGRGALTVPPTHDRIGHLVLEFLEGERRSGLPRGAALLAFARAHHLKPAAVDQVRAVLRIVEGAERSRAAA